MVACGPWLCFSLQVFLRSRIQIHLALAFHNTHLHRAPFDFSPALTLYLPRNPSFLVIFRITPPQMESL